MRGDVSVIREKAYPLRGSITVFHRVGLLGGVIAVEDPYRIRPRGLNIIHRINKKVGSQQGERHATAVSHY